MKYLKIPVLTLAVMAIGSAALADWDTWDPAAHDLNLKYAGAEGKTARLYLDGTDKGNIVTGRYKLRIGAIGNSTDPDWAEDGLPNDRWSYCVDLLDWASSAYKPYDIIALKDAPNDAPMGPDKAEDVSEFWKGVADNVGDPLGAGFSSANAASFALGVWNIVFDTDLDVKSYGGPGSTGFKTTTTGSWVDQANTWLSAYVGSGDPKSDLVAVYNEKYQDYSVTDPTAGEEVPGPMMFIQILGLGMMGLVGWRRRRR
jgi:hypothetical protein